MCTASQDSGVLSGNLGGLGGDNCGVAITTVVRLSHKHML